MNTVRATAPGKIVLGGEYAVLHGAHAVAASIDRLATVALKPIDSPWIELRAPGFSDEKIRYSVTQDGFLKPQKRISAAKDFGLFERAWLACRPKSVRGTLITLDTSAFVDPERGSKLGLGSSAALCVALTAALQNDFDKNAIAQVARKVHHDFQGGGSGVDIACAVHGGIIDYCHDESVPAAVTIPSGLHLAVLWSGKPASTSAKIKALSTSLQAGGRRATLDNLCAAANALAGSWRSDDAIQLFSQFQLFVEALHDFDADHQLGIYAHGHAEMAAAANQHGLLYKPCGAGGGDVGVAIALEPGKLKSFAALAPGLGFRLLDVDFGVAGVRCTRENHGS